MKNQREYLLAVLLFPCTAQLILIRFTCSAKYAVQSLLFIFSCSAKFAAQLLLFILTYSGRNAAQLLLFTFTLPAESPAISKHAWEKSPCEFFKAKKGELPVAPHVMKPKAIGVLRSFKKLLFLKHSKIRSGSGDIHFQS